MSEIKTERFLQGDLVRCLQRTKNNELFLMVLFEKNPSPTQFLAVVIKDMAQLEETGLVADNWNTDQFELLYWDEFYNRLLF
jgi:hypothetical protein